MNALDYKMNEKKINRKGYRKDYTLNGWIVSCGRPTFQVRINRIDCKVMSGIRWMDAWLQWIYYVVIFSWVMIMMMIVVVVVLIL